MLSELHVSEGKDLHVINRNVNSTSEIVLSHVVEWTWYRLFNMAISTISSDKVKVKMFAMTAYAGNRGVAPFIRNFRCWMEVSGELYALVSTLRGCVGLTKLHALASSTH